MTVENVPFIIIGNKTDCSDKEVLDKDILDLEK